MTDVDQAVAQLTRRVDAFHRAPTTGVAVFGGEDIVYLGAVLKRLAALEAENTQQLASLTELAPLSTATERDQFAVRVAELEAENEQLRFSKTALTQTINAYPDAVANGAANLAHARAQRDEMSQRVTELRGEVKELYARIAERDAEIGLANEERAYWKQLYDDYCKPEDISAMEIARDEAVRRADETEEQLRELAAKHGDLHAQFKDRSDYAQRVWLAWCSARDRARGRLGDNCNSGLNAAYARIRELEAERDASVLEYLRTHPDETRRIIERERQRLAAPPDIVRRTMGQEFQP